MWADRFSVAGKVVFLTGAAGGIGLALVKAFLEGGGSGFRRHSAAGIGLAGIGYALWGCLTPCFLPSGI